MTARRVLVAAAVAVALAAGCGDDGAVIAPGAVRALEASLADLRAAVEAEDRGAAERALDRLIASADRWAGRGRIDEDRLGEILAAAEDVAADLAVLPASTPSDPSLGVDAPSSDTDHDGPADDHDTGPPPHAESQAKGEDDEDKGKDDEDKGKGKDD